MFTITKETVEINFVIGEEWRNLINLFFFGGGGECGGESDENKKTLENVLRQINKK